MLQVNIHGPGKFALDEVPIPSAGPADVVVDVAACGICGSDLGYVAAGGLMGPSDRPMPLGHELSGTIAQLGSEVTGMTVGQRVVVNPMGANNLIGNGGPEGGFAPQLLVRNAVLGESIFELPQQLDYELGALVEPLAVATHGINQANPGKDSKVLVLGAGPIGLATVAVLKYRGVKNIVAMDLSHERLQRAGALGATTLVNAAAGTMPELVTPAHGSAEVYGMPALGTDIYIEATGVRAVVEDVLANIKIGATLVIVGLHKQDIPVSFGNILAREITIKGSLAYPNEFPEVIEMLASGKVDVSPMISHRYGLREFEQAFSAASNTGMAAKVIVTME